METEARASGLGWLGAPRAHAWRWSLRALGRGSQGAGRLHAYDAAQRDRGRAMCERDGEF
jgi:hypothetical protein